MAGIMKIIYRSINGFWVDRLITQHRFESVASSPEGMRKARAWLKSHPHPSTERQPEVKP